MADNNFVIDFIGNIDMSKVNQQLNEAKQNVDSLKNAFDSALGQDMPHTANILNRSLQRTEGLIDSVRNKATTINSDRFQNDGDRQNYRIRATQTSKELNAAMYMYRNSNFGTSVAHELARALPTALKKQIDGIIPQLAATVKTSFTALGKRTAARGSYDQVISDLSYDTNINKLFNGLKSGSLNANQRKQVLSVIASSVAPMASFNEYMQARFGNNYDRTMRAKDVIPFEKILPKSFISSLESGSYKKATFDGDSGNKVLQQKQWEGLYQSISQNAIATRAALTSGIAKRSNTGMLQLSRNVTQNAIEDYRSALFDEYVNRVSGGGKNAIDPFNSANRDVVIRRSMASSAGKAAKALTDVEAIYSPASFGEPVGKTGYAKIKNEQKRILDEYYIQKYDINGKATGQVTLSQSQATDLLGNGKWKNNQDVSDTVAIVRVTDNSDETKQKVADLYRNGKTINGKHYSWVGSHSNDRAVDIRLVEDTAKNAVDARYRQAATSIGYSPNSSIWSGYQDAEMERKIKSGTIKLEDWGKFNDSRQKIWTPSYDPGIRMNGRKIAVVQLDDKDKAHMADGTGWVSEDIMPMFAQNRGGIAIKGTLNPYKFHNNYEYAKANGFLNKDGRFVVGDQDITDASGFIDITQIKNLNAYRDENGNLPDMATLSDMVSKSLQIFPFRVAADLSEAETAKRLGAQTSTFMKYNPSIIAKQTQGLIKRLNELQTQEGRLTYLFGDKDDAMSEFLRSPEGRPYLFSDEVNSRAQAYSNALLRDSARGNFINFGDASMKYIAATTSPISALLKSSTGLSDKDIISKSREILSKANNGKEYSDDEIKKLLYLQAGTSIDFNNMDSDQVGYVRSPYGFGNGLVAKNIAKQVAPLFDAFGISKQGAYLSPYDADKLQGIDYDSDHVVSMTGYTADILKETLASVPQVDEAKKAIRTQAYEFANATDAAESASQIVALSVKKTQDMGAANESVRAAQYDLTNPNNIYKAIAAYQAQAYYDAVSTQDKKPIVANKTTEMWGSTNAGRPFHEFMKHASQLYSLDDGMVAEDGSVIDTANVFRASDGRLINLKKLRDMKIGMYNMPSIYNPAAVMTNARQSAAYNAGLVDPTQFEDILEAMRFNGTVAEEGSNADKLLKTNEELLVQYMSGKRHKISGAQKEQYRDLISATESQIQQEVAKNIDQRTGRVTVHGQSFRKPEDAIKKLRQMYGVDSAIRTLDEFGFTEQRIADLAQKDPELYNGFLSPNSANSELTYHADRDYLPNKINKEKALKKAQIQKLVDGVGDEQIPFDEGKESKVDDKIQENAKTQKDRAEQIAEYEALLSKLHEAQEKAITSTGNEDPKLTAYIEDVKDMIAEASGNQNKKHNNSQKAVDIARSGIVDIQSAENAFAGVMNGFVDAEAKKAIAQSLIQKVDKSNKEFVNDSFMKDRREQTAADKYFAMSKWKISSAEKDYEWAKENLGAEFAQGSPLRAKADISLGNLRANYYDAVKGWSQSRISSLSENMRKTMSSIGSSRTGNLSSIQALDNMVKQAESVLFNFDNNRIKGSEEYEKTTAKDIRKKLEEDLQSIRTRRDEAAGIITERFRANNYQNMLGRDIRARQIEQNASDIEAGMFLRNSGLQNTQLGQSIQYTRGKYKEFLNRSNNARQQIAQTQRFISDQEFLKRNGTTEEKIAAEENIKAANNQLAIYNKELQNAQSGMEAFSGSSGVMSTALDAINQSLVRVVSRFGRQLFQKATQEAIKFTQEFNAAMTEIQMVTLKTDDQMSQLGDGFISKAVQLKKSITDVTSAATALYRQGLSDSEVNSRLDDILKFSTVSGVKATDATKIATVAVNSGMAKNAQEVFDIISALGDGMPTNAAQLFKGLQKSLPAAKQANMSLPQLLAMLTQITSATQLSGNIAGTTMNTVIARLSKIGTNELFYDESGNPYSGSAIADSLRLVGIDTYKDGKARNPYDILSDLGHKWETLDDGQKNQITNAIASTRQASNFAAIMQGFSEVDENGRSIMDTLLALTQQAEGITDEKYSVWAKSLAAAMNEVKSSFDMLVASLNVGEVGTGFMNAFADFLQGLAYFNDSAAGTVVKIGLITAAVVALTAALASNPIGQIGMLVGGALTIMSGIGTMLNGSKYTSQYEQVKTDVSKKISAQNGYVQRAQEINNKLLNGENITDAQRIELAETLIQLKNLGVISADTVTNIDKLSGAANDTATQLSKAADNIEKSAQQQLYNAAYKDFASAAANYSTVDSHAVTTEQYDNGARQSLLDYINAPSSDLNFMSPEAINDIISIIQRIGPEKLEFTSDDLGTTIPWKSMNTNFKQWLIRQKDPQLESFLRDYYESGILQSIVSNGNGIGTYLRPQIETMFRGNTGIRGNLYDDAIIESVVSYLNDNFTNDPPSATAWIRSTFSPTATQTSAQRMRAYAADNGLIPKQVQNIETSTGQAYDENYLRTISKSSYNSGIEGKFISVYSDLYKNVPYLFDRGMSFGNVLGQLNKASQNGSGVYGQLDDAILKNPQLGKLIMDYYNGDVGEEDARSEFMRIIASNVDGASLMAQYRNRSTIANTARDNIDLITGSDTPKAAFENLLQSRQKDLVDILGEDTVAQLQAGNITDAASLAYVKDKINAYATGTSARSNSAIAARAMSLMSAQSIGEFADSMYRVEYDDITKAFDGLNEYVEAQRMSETERERKGWNDEWMQNRRNELLAQMQQAQLEDNDVTRTITPWIAQMYGTPSDQMKMFGDMSKQQTQIRNAQYALDSIFSGSFTDSAYNIIEGFTGYDQKTIDKMMEDPKQQKILEGIITQFKDNATGSIQTFFKMFLPEDALKAGLDADGIVEEAERAGVTLNEAFINALYMLEAQVDENGNFHIGDGIDTTYSSGLNKQYSDYMKSNDMSDYFDALIGNAANMSTANKAWGTTFDEYLSKNTQFENWDAFWQKNQETMLYTKAYENGQIGTDEYVRYLRDQQRFTKLSPLDQIAPGMAALFGSNWQSGDYDLSSVLSNFVTMNDQSNPYGLALLNDISGFEGMTDLLTLLQDYDAQASDAQAQSKKLSEAIQKVLDAVDSEKVKDQLKFNRALDSTAKTMKALQAGGSDAADAMLDVYEQTKNIGYARDALEKYQAGNRSDNVTGFLAKKFNKADQNTLKKASKEQAKFLYETMSKSLQDESDILETNLGTNLTNLIQKNIAQIDNLPKDFSLSDFVLDGKVNTDGIIAAFTSAGGVVDQAWVALVQVLSNLGATFTVGADGNTLGVDLNGIKTGGYKGGGGSKGKTAAQKLIEKQGFGKDLYEHQIKMVQYEQTRYENADELTNYGKMIEEQIKIEQAYLPVVKANIEALESQLSSTKEGSEDWYKLRNAILAAHEQLSQINNAIADNNKKLKENQQAILKTHTDLEDIVSEEIATRIQEQRDQLSGTVSMEDTILNAIKRRYQDEWDLIKKGVQKQKEALEEKKSLIDEYLNKRKDAEDEAEKYEKLNELKKQLAYISTDTTRTKDAADLRDQIAQLEKEIGWDIAERQADVEKQGIQDQIDAYDSYIKEGEEDLDLLLQDANNFAEQLNGVMKLNQTELFNWLKQNVKEYANSVAEMQEQMVQSWEDTYKQMMGITDTYWDDVDRTLSSKESFLEYMKQSSAYVNASDDQKAQMVYEWEEAYDRWMKAKMNTADYNHSDTGLGNFSASEYTGSSSSGGSGGGGGNNNTNTPTQTQQSSNLVTDVQTKPGNIQTGQTSTGPYTVRDGKMNLILTTSSFTTASTTARSVALGNTGKAYIYDYTGTLVNSYTPNSSSSNATTSNPSTSMPTTGWPTGLSSGWHYKITKDGVNVTYSANSYKSQEAAQAAAQKDPKWASGMKYQTKQFELGGIADFTGPIWIDGTKQRPQRILNARQTESFDRLVGIMDNWSNFAPSLSSPFSVASESLGGNVANVGDVYVTLNEATINDDRDYDEIASLVGQKFVKELSKQGLNVAAYAF